MRFRKKRAKNVQLWTLVSPWIFIEKSWNFPAAAFTADWERRVFWREGCTASNSIVLEQKLGYSIVIISVLKLDESESGQMEYEKVKWVYSDAYLSQTMWNHTKNSMKKLKRPISLLFARKISWYGRCPIAKTLNLAIWAFSSIFFAWFHIVCDRYASEYAHFTF